MINARVRTVTLNANDLASVASFWCRFLSVEITEGDEETGLVWLAPDSPGGVTIAVQQVVLPDSPVGVSTVHLDVSVDDLDAAEERVIQLGGQLVAQNVTEGGFEWRVLADPEGNQFCVYREGSES